MSSLMSILKAAGFTGEGLKMAYAIAMAESGGNAHAHNGNAGTGDNSYGLFQINMLGSMGPARRKQYGLKSNNDLFDPLTNARVAYKMSGGGKHWGPWSTYGSGAYKRYYGGSSASVKNQGSGSFGSGTGSGYISPTSVHLSDKELAAEYGFTSAFLNSNPELKGIFKQAVANTWSADRFKAALQNTKWWRTHSSTERQYLMDRFMDPATGKQSLAQNQVRARQIGNQLGIVETAFTKKKIAEAAYNMTAKGWDENQVRYYLGQYVYFSGDKHQGQGGEEWDALHSYAYSMGVTMASSWYADKSRNIVRGIATEQDYKNEILNKAKAAFPMYKKELEGGQTVADIANPYFQSMSQILELPGGSINLFDPTIKKALQYKNPTTGKQEVKPMWQFENDLRNDPRWKKTQNAQDSMMQVAHQVLTDFGVKY